jgi:hypothetical protein
MIELILTHPGLTCVILAVGVCLGLILAAAGGDPEREVVLVDAGPRKIAVIKAIRQLTELSLREAKALTDHPGSVVDLLPAAEAEQARRVLEAAGAKVSLRGGCALPGERVRVGARVQVGRRQRVFVHREGGYSHTLGPGRHLVWGRAGLVRVSTLERQLQDRRQAEYLADPAVAQELTVVELEQDQRALVWDAGRLLVVLGPGRHAFWRGDEPLRVEAHSVSPEAPRFEHPLLEAALSGRQHGCALREMRVAPGHVGLLQVDGRVREELPPGRYAVWEGVAQVELQAVDLRHRSVEVCHGVMTRDKVELTLSATAEFRVHAARLSREALDRDVATALSRRVGQALGEATAHRGLDEVLADTRAVAHAAWEGLASSVRAFGVTLERIGVSHVALPGDVRQLLVQTVEARARAEAERVVRREETAAARSQLNTARLMERSPELRRLRELEVAERIAASVGELRVHAGAGGLTGLATRLLPRR